MARESLKLPTGGTFKVAITEIETEPEPPRTITAEITSEKKEKKEMAKAVKERQLEIFEVRTEDGGVGLQFGDGPVFLGYDESDLARLLEQIFTGSYNAPSFIDAELYDLAHMYLDEERAQERTRELR